MGTFQEVFHVTSLTIHSVHWPKDLIDPVLTKNFDFEIRLDLQWFSVGYLRYLGAEVLEVQKRGQRGKTNNLSLLIPPDLKSHSDVLTYIAKHARLPISFTIPTCHAKFCKALALIWTRFRPCKSICIGKLQFNSIATLLNRVKTCKLFLWSSNPNTISNLTP